MLSGLLGVSALAWGYTFYLARDMGNVDMAMVQLTPWAASEFLLMYVMWAVMMVAMMIPTAAPMILIFATVNRRRAERNVPFVSTGVVPAGVRARLERVCRRGDPGPMGTPQRLPSFSHDGDHQQRSGRDHPRGRRSLPVEPHQVCLPQQLSLTPRNLAGKWRRLASGYTWSQQA